MVEKYKWTINRQLINKCKTWVCNKLFRRLYLDEYIFENKSGKIEHTMQHFGGNGLEVKNDIGHIINKGMILGEGIAKDYNRNINATVGIGYKF